MRTKRRFFWIVPLFLAAAGLACTLSAPTPAAWSLTPTAQVLQATQAARHVTETAAALQIVPVVVPTNTPLPRTAVPSPQNPLLAQGPWLVYPLEGGRSVAVLNPDGSGRTLIEVPGLFQPRDLISGMAPHGGMIAVRVGNTATFEDLALYLITLPEGSVEAVASLVSRLLLQQVKGAAGTLPQAAQALIQPDSLAWSPNGRYLAFISAADGVSADLYVYDSTNRSVRRMTRGSDQAATPFWSNDSQWIITQGVDDFGTGQGWKLSTVWAMNVIKEESRRLYTPPAQSTREVFLGWMPDGDLISYSLTASGGRDLRTVNMEKLRAATLFSGPFLSLAYDPGDQTAAFTQDQTTIGLTGLAPGFYLFSLNDETSRGVEAGAWQQVEWISDAGLFFASGERGMLVVSAQGNASLLPGESQAALAPNARWLAAWGDGKTGTSGLRLYTASGSLLQSLTAEPVTAVSWPPDASGIFFISQQQLMLAPFPGLAVQTVDQGLGVEDGPVLNWVRQ